MKYCPQCDAEYREGYSLCADCGVELVSPEHRRPKKTPSREPLVRVWLGGDIVAFCYAIEVLREAGIRHHVIANHDHLVFGFAMARPRYEVLVFQSDADKARELLEPIRESLPFASETSPEEANKGAEEPPQRRPTAWNIAAATVELWNGEDPKFVRNLLDCLRENRIGVRGESKPAGILRLFVMPEDAEAAREIVREILEGTPPA